MVLILAIAIFLFSVYALSVDDFIFMRKNVSLIALFDILILSGLVGLFISRLTFASLHPSFAYLNPLVFFVIPYFPGLSLPGFLIGAILAVYLLGMKEKLPTGRIFDMFALSLYPATTFFFTWMFVENILKRNFYTAVVYSIACVLAVIFFFFFKRFLAKSSWRDGSISLGAFGVSTSLFLLLQFALDKFRSLPLELSLFALLLCILFVTFLIRQFRRAGERS